MGDTYTRQSSYTDGDVITAAHTNDEFNQLLAAFATSSGHTHDGTTAEGGPITKLLGNTLSFGDGTTDSDIAITFNANANDGLLTWKEDEDYFEFNDDILIATTEKLQFRDTAIYINSSTDGQLDLVADTEIQIAATTIDMNGAVDISGNLTVGGNLDVTGTVSFSDNNITDVGTIGVDSIFGDGDTNTNISFSGSDVITFTTGGETQFTVNNGSIVPTTDDDIDLGTSSLQFKDAYIDGIAYIDTLDLNGTTITSTAAELNILDGVTATAAELNALDGITSTVAELNILDGVTSTAAELNALDGITAVVGELNALDIGSTAIGTAVASKAVILDANKDYTGIRNLTLAGDLTISGDDLVMGTNTAGHLLIADGTNFNPTAVGDLTEISTVANDDVFLAVDTSGGGLKKVTRSTIVSGLAVGGVAISNVVEDTTPQLGGNLDMNGADIVTTSNATIDLAPNGTGTVVVRGNSNSGAIVFNCESNSHGQTVRAQPHSASATNTMLLPEGANSTLVSLVSTDTLTNKTLTSPKINEDVAVTSTATELNLLDGVTATTAELNALDGITAVVGELNALDLGSTAVGTAIASKAVILDSNKDYTGIRNFTVSGELDAATGDFSGAIDVAGTANLDVVDIDGAVNIAAATTIATNNKIIFRDAAIHISSTADGDLSIAADDEIDLTSTLIDINGNVEISGTAAITGIATFTDDIIIGDGKTIGSASDVDAMTIASNGQITLTQTLIGTALDISGDIDVDGTTNLDVVDIDGAVDMASTLQVDGAITNSSTIVSTGKITSDAGIDIDNFNIDGTTIALSSGDMTIDVAGDLILDAGGGDFKFGVGDTEILRITNSSSDVIIKPIVDAKDIIFQQRDGTAVMTVEDDVSLNINNDVFVTGRAAGTMTTDNDGNLDLAVSNNFKVTTGGDLTLTLTNPAIGQSGNILFINGSNHTISAHASILINADVLTAISATGSYHLTYYATATSGNNTILVSASAILT